MLVFDVVRPVRSISRSRSSVGERPPHTRKVAGSKPAGTTTQYSNSHASRPVIDAWPTLQLIPVNVDISRCVAP